MNLTTNITGNYVAGTNIVIYRHLPSPYSQELIYIATNRIRRFRQLIESKTTTIMYRLQKYLASLQRDVRL